MTKEIERGIKSNFLSHVLSTEGMGSIHSVFKSSLNISIKGKLIHIGQKGTGISSFGMNISKEEMADLLTKVRIDDRVKNRNGKVTIYSRGGIWNFSHSDFETYDCSVPTINGMGADFLTDLLQHFESLQIEKETQLMDSEQNQILLTKFLDANWEDETFQRMFITHFIGRGIGLTPSGDDMLMGIMMAYQAFWPEGRWVNTLIKQLEVSRTTDVSTAYYRTLAEGYTSSYFVEFMQDLKDQDLKKWRERIRRISQYGHTSGWDTLYGIYLFFQKIEKSMNNGRGE